MEKLDLIKKYKSYFTAKKIPQIIEIDTANYLSILGKGDPSDKLFIENIQALYATAYTVKFIYKALGKDFIVSKLEGLWWFDEKKFGNYSIMEAAVKIPRNEWEYRLLIRIPTYVINEEIQKAIQTVISKKKLNLAHNIEYFEMKEGKAVQILHIGPFTNEPDTLQQVDIFMKANNFSKNGLHHEIYLSDFNKTDPDKLKTILREPVK